MFTILGTIVVGLIVGLIARAVKPGDDKLGWIMTRLAGLHRRGDRAALHLWSGEEKSLIRPDRAGSGTRSENMNEIWLQRLSYRR